MKIQHAILEAASYPNQKKSSVIFNNEFVLASAAILQPFFLEKNSLFADTEIEDLKNMLRSNEVIEPPEKISDTLERIHFNVIFDQLQIGAKPKYLVKHNTRVLYMFKSKAIFTCISPIIDKLNNQITSSRSDDSCEVLKLISSAFILLKIDASGQQLNTDWEDLLKILKTYVQVLEPIKKLEEVLTISSPFGLEIFYKTINFGRISTVLGKNNSVFFISNSLTEDCEGSAVFNSKMKLIGIVIFTSVPLSGVLVGGLQNILSEFLYKLGKLRKPSHLIWKSCALEKSVVLVNNSLAQGSGVFTKILGKNLILTCSHVVYELQKTNCIYADGSIECKVLWSNPEFDTPYDIALLEAPPTLPDSYFVRISNQRPKIGQLCYSAGFPYFSTDTQSQGPNSCMSEGRVVKYVPGFLVTDTYVDAGLSGGPLFDENGYIIGICVCNAKGKNNLYPRFNMSVPLWDVKTTLEEYVKTKEIKVLNKLIANANVQGLWKLRMPEVRSQL